jgi:Asp-tRNA(Asn)/Glu-tRNA(Gln) amidotransferase A subunit family amidase
MPAIVEADRGPALDKPRSGQIWRRFQAFLERYEYFVLPTTQLPPFDVNTIPKTDRRREIR